MKILVCKWLLVLLLIGSAVSSMAVEMDANLYDIYAGDLDGNGSADFYFQGKDRYLILASDISIPVLFQKIPSYAIYQNADGYTAPAIFSLSSGELSSYILQGKLRKLVLSSTNLGSGVDGLYWRDNANGFTSLMLRGATSTDPALLLATTSNSDLPLVVNSYSYNSDQPNISDHANSFTLIDKNSDGLRDLVVGSQVFLANYSGLISGNAVSVSSLGLQKEKPYTSVTRYNLAGQVTGAIDPDPDGYGPLHYPATRNTYNTRGLLIKVESGELQYWQSEVVAPSEWPDFIVKHLVVYSYDSYGRTVVEAGLDLLNNTKILAQYNYDDRSRVKCKAIRMNPGLYTAPDFSNLPDACEMGTEGAFGPDRITQYTYDDLNQILTETRGLHTPNQQVYVTNEYYKDDWNRETRLLKHQTDGNGNVTELRYDDFGRLLRRIYPSQSSIGAINENDYNEYKYDANGNVIYERKRNGAVINYAYDNNNRLILKDVVDNSKEQDVQYNYDLGGKTLSSRFCDKSVSAQNCDNSKHGVTNAYDGFGRLISTTNNVWGGSHTLNYAYDGDSNRLRVIHPDGVSYGYTYDNDDRATGIQEYATQSSAGSELITFSYKPSSLRDSIRRDSGSTTSYYYDDLARLSSFQQDFMGTENDLRNSFDFNPAGQITTLTQSNDKYSYVGNDNQTGIYKADGLNRYTEVGGKTFGYDGNSNLTNDGPYTYGYDDENRLISVSGPSTASFKYDPLGHLYQATVNGITTYFLYDGDALIAEYNSSGTMTARYVHGDRTDEPLVEYDGSNIGISARRYLYADHQGSIIANTDGWGNVLNSLSYDSFGIPAAANIGRFGYTGQVWFRQLGLDYYKARFYSPKLGRFLQTDPIFYQDDMDLYAYVGNDPVNRVDPTGKFWWFFAALFLEGGTATTTAAVTTAAVTTTATVTTTDIALAGAVVYSAANAAHVQQGLTSLNNENSESSEQETHAPTAESDAAPTGQRAKNPPDEGPPNEFVQGPRRGREYDENGKPKRDYDKPHQGNKVDHVHEWENGEREEPGRPYSPLPRTEKY